MAQNSTYQNAKEGILVSELPNVRKLADYINAQRNPQAFAKTLLTLCKPCANDIADGKHKA